MDGCDGHSRSTYGDGQDLMNIQESMYLPDFHI